MKRGRKSQQLKEPPAKRVRTVEDDDHAPTGYHVLISDVWGYLTSEKFLPDYDRVAFKLTCKDAARADPKPLHVPAVLKQLFNMLGDAPSPVYYDALAAFHFQGLATLPDKALTAAMGEKKNYVHVAVDRVLYGNKCELPEIFAAPDPFIRLEYNEGRWDCVSPAGDASLWLGCITGDEVHYLKRIFMTYLVGRLSGSGVMPVTRWWKVHLFRLLKRFRVPLLKISRWNPIRPHPVYAILHAMEQQRIILAKARLSYEIARDSQKLHSSQEMAKLLFPWDQQESSESGPPPVSMEEVNATENVYKTERRCYHQIRAKAVSLHQAESEVIAWIDARRERRLQLNSLFTNFRRCQMERYFSFVAFTLGYLSWERFREDDNIRLIYQRFVASYSASDAWSFCRQVRPDLFGRCLYCTGHYVAGPASCSICSRMRSSSSSDN